MQVVAFHQVLTQQHFIKAHRQRTSVATLVQGTPYQDDE
jgi:hypothetical protein